MTEDEFAEHLSYLENYEDEYIACDTENSGTIRPSDLWAGLHYATGFSLGYRYGESFRAGYFPWRHESDNLPLSYLSKLKPILLEHTLIFCNQWIDMAGLETLGIELVKPSVDITWLFHLANEEIPSKSLEWLSQQFLGEGKAKDKYFEHWVKYYGWDTIPVSMIEAYGAQDAILPFKLFDLVRGNLD